MHSRRTSDNRLATADGGDRKSRTARIQHSKLLFETMIVAGATIAMLIAIRTQTPPNGFVGLDAWQYLGNVMAVENSEWGRYHTWRGPLHALVLTWLMGPLDGLRQAASWLSAVAISGCVPLVWGLGRSISGKLAGLTAAVLFAATPELLDIGTWHSSYGLCVFLINAGLLASIAKRTWYSSLLAALSFGLASLVDTRAVPIMIAVFLTSAWFNRNTLRTLSYPTLAAGIAITIWAYGSSLVPVDFVSFLDRLIIQNESTLAAHPHLSDCVGAMYGRKSWTTVLAPCSIRIFWENLRALSNALPWTLWSIVLLSYFVTPFCKTNRSSARWALLAALGCMVPAIFVADVPPRYLVLVGGPLAVLLATGILSLSRRASLWSRHWTIIPVAVVATLVGTRHIEGRQLHDGPRPDRPSSKLAEIAAVLETGGRETAVIYDCSGLHLNLYLAPRQVVSGRVPKGVVRFNPLGETLSETMRQKCARVRKAGHQGGGAAFIVIQVREDMPRTRLSAVLWKKIYQPENAVASAPTYAVYQSTGLSRSDGARKVPPH